MAQSPRLPVVPLVQGRGETSWEHPLDPHFKKLVTHLRAKLAGASGFQRADDFE